MGVLSRNYKVHTSEATAAIDAEDVGVEGKRYPTNAFGRAMTTHPCTMLLTIVLPIVFFIIGCVYIGDSIRYSLTDFQLSSSVLVRKSADDYAATMDAWTETISGSRVLASFVDRTNPRSRARDTIELRARIDDGLLQEYCIEYDVDLKVACVKLANMLNQQNLFTMNAIESQIRRLPSYEDVCFTNDLEYGRINNVILPACVPPNSLGGYAFASYNSSSPDLWHADGDGTYFQQNFIPRLLVNPSYSWFVESNFSVLHQSSKALRTGFVMAASPRQSDKDYHNKVKTFVLDAVQYISGSTAHPFIHIYVGGDVVENIKIEGVASKEGYKVGVAFVICFVLSWWHCGSFMMGLYAGAQVIFTYMAAVGLYAIIYKALPLMTYSAVIWVMTFGLHGTLSFYDMFVYTGVMATKGRQNNLSVPQRICFTIRRVTLGVWLANVLAIVIFAVNTTSAFDSVRQFSVLMIIAFLWNMYFVLLPTPAWVCAHHFYFSNKRRNLQKQVDVLNMKAQACRRSDASVAVLSAVRANASLGEVVYSLDEDVIAARIGTDRGINSKHYNGIGSYLKREIRQGHDKLRNARDEIVGAAHKVRKTKRQMLHQNVNGSPGGGENGDSGLRPFEMEEFADVGNASRRNSHAALYVNRRLVRHADVVHVAGEMTMRSESTWTLMCDALKQRNDGGLAPPHVHSLMTVGDNDRGVHTFSTKWNAVCSALRVEGTELAGVDEALPLVARAVVRAQDPSYVVGGRKLNGGSTHEANASKNASVGATSSAPQEGEKSSTVDVLDVADETPLVMQAERQGRGIVDPGSAGMGLQKIRHRWRNHNTALRRSSCCGLCGKVQTETADQRMSRLMHRKVKREGYTHFERFIIRTYVPFVHWARWVLLLLLIVLCVLVCVFGSFIRRAGLPTSLVTTDIGQSAGWADMDDAFGQRGTCTFCGPYYRPTSDYRTSNATDVAVCGPQMNIIPDRCGVCGGSDACLDCAGVPNGEHVQQCDSCELPTASSCTCAASRACPFCEWNYGLSHVFGGKCKVACSEDTCKNGGRCNDYTGKCDCAENFSGEHCEECANWLLPLTYNPECHWECNARYNSEQCACNTYAGLCMSCPVGTRGYNCDKPAMDCGAHGTYDTTLGACTCAAGWGGAVCNMSEKCNYRGGWLEASESPTGEAMCACTGHWRGPTCQLCDCLNGGMCDDTTGVCQCRGAFVGARCQTCAGTCVAHGSCPTDLPSSSLNVRACIDERCPDAQKNAETTCDSCPEPSSVSKSCLGYTDAASCSQHGECWWSSFVSTCYSAMWDGKAVTDSTFDCTCNNAEVWTGPSCGVCLAPKGGTCKIDDTIVDCTGRVRTKSADAIAEDTCGVCGGDGLCRGCDGVPGSGLVYDVCGVCGGNGACIGLENRRSVNPIRVYYMLDMTKAQRECTNADSSEEKSCSFNDAVTDAIDDFAALARNYGADLETANIVIADFVKARGKYTNDTDFYSYVRSQGRMSEAVFSFGADGTSVKALTHVVYPVLTSRTAFREANSADGYVYVVARSDSELWIFLNNNVAHYGFSLLKNYNIDALFTAPQFPSGMAVYLSDLSLWFAVGIGIAVCFAFLYIFFVSILTALGGTAVAAIVCFGTLCVCRMFRPQWELDAVLQVCVSCTIPIAVEYVVHLCSGYFDYLQTTTSHLFARDVSRKTALTGALLRSMPSVCTSVVAVVLSSIMFDVSDLLPSKRSGQVCITMHLVLLVAFFFFSGATAAIGPSRNYQHWTLSVLIFLICGVLAGIGVAAMYAAGGIMTPNGVLVLSKRKN